MDDDDDDDYDDDDDDSELTQWFFRTWCPCCACGLPASLDHRRGTSALLRVSCYIDVRRFPKMVNTLW